MLLPRDGALGIDLQRGQQTILIDYQDATYNFTVEEMFSDHHRIHRCGIFECQEREAARATSSIPHDRARLDLAELREILLQRLCDDTVQYYYR